MNLEAIQNMVDAGQESTILEFKKSTAQLKGAAETLCAFLNGCGGTVLIGVTDTGKIIGQEVTDSTKRAIGNMLAQLSPEANIKVTYVLIKNEKVVIVLEAAPNPSLRPYTFDSKPYIRLESNTIAMPREQYQRMSVHNALNNRNWESEILTKASFDDLDSEEIMRTLSEGIANKRIPADQLTDKPEIVLKKLGLLRDGKITNAAMVLYGREPNYWFPQCSIRLARFKGIDKAEFIDSKVVDGNAFKIIREAMIFADRYLPVSSNFPSNSIYRHDEPLFPVDVLREVFANAVGHRDYDYMRTATPSFAIYDDRLEIWSPGLPPKGVTFDNIKILHESIPRNHLIAKVLYYNKLFESWGRGVKMIIDLCVQAGHPDPEFIERTGGVCVRLQSKQSMGAPVIYDVQKSSADLKLTARQKRILEIIQQEDKVTISDITKQLSDKVTQRTVQRDLAKLKDCGFIEMVGETKGAVWAAITT